MPTTVKPSRRFRQLVAQFETPRAAALKWGIEPLILDRFLEERGCINLRTAAQIIERTGLDYDVLFQHVETKS